MRLHVAKGKVCSKSSCGIVFRSGCREGTKKFLRFFLPTKMSGYPKITEFDLDSKREWNEVNKVTKQPICGQTVLTP